MLQHADELSLLQAQIVYKKRLEAVMRELTAQETALQEKVRLLKQQLLMEEKDVEKLEGHSLAAFFYHVTGQMDAILDRERREAWAARIKYDTALRELDAIQEDIRETEEDLRDLQDCEERYTRQLTQLRESMESEQSREGALLLEKEQLVSHLSQQELELEEAIIAGTSALRTMASVQQDLNRAKDWSVFEARGAAFWADHARQERLEVARENVGLLQVQLQKFNRELSDVDIRGNLQVSIDRMLQFADAFFDELLTDAALSEKIRRSCTLADQTREHILGVLRQLQNSLEEVRHRHKRIRQEMDSIVLQAVNE